jgi:teichuronic acid biosynthesis glycosyltransferase TuaC
MAAARRHQGWSAPNFCDGVRCRLRVAAVTSQFPVDGDPNRGRPIVQTLAALAKLAQVEVFVPNARYPRWLAPRSYQYGRPADHRAEVEGLTTHYCTYGTLPIVGRVANGLGAARTLRGPLAVFRPDVLLSYWLYPDAFGAAVVATELGVPLVAGARGSDIRARDRISLLLTRRVLARSARILTVSEDLRRIAIERFGASAAFTSSVPNGCDTRIFRLGSRFAARAELGVPQDAKLILFVGRVVAAKGLRELATACLDAARTDPHVQLAIVGQGPLLAELSGCMAQERAERFHAPGALPPNEVAAWMRACDVFCLPSHTEGYPNVLVEALACGRPVVATPVGGINEIVDTDSGLLTPVKDPVRLAAALRAALSRSWDEVALSRRFARSWDDVARETLAVCEAARARRA